MTEFTLDDLLGGSRGRPEDVLGSVRCGHQLERLLGRGGMGAVYLARGPQGAAVVKVLAPELAGDPHLRERFRREWAALQKIHPHPNVVRVLAVADDDPPALVMEHVAGPSLLRLLQEHGRVEPRRAVRLARDAARGLAVVHGHGLIHRDIKPGNILVAPDGAAKLVDFGLAKDLFRTAITKTGQVMGTAHYMAPEQFGEEPVVDPRCDLFALGATLYHLLCGRAPFVGEDVPETVDLITSGDYDPLDEVLEAPPPPGLVDVLSQLLEPDLRYRYESAQACADDLDRVLRGEPVPIVCLRLEQPAGACFPLLPGRRFTLGAEPSCQVPLPVAGVAPRHAQLRREARGFTLRALKGNPTLVDDAPLSAAHLLSPGERVQVGQATLRFEDPRAASAAEPYLADVRREVVAAPLLEALIATRDPRAALALLERLAPDPRREGAILRALRDLVPPAQLDAPIARRRAQVAAEASRALALLPLLTGAAPQTDPRAWLGWWSQVRAQAPVQLGPAPALGAQVVVLEGEPGPRAADLDRESVLLIGRDRRCRLRLIHPSAARLHATVLRLHRRLVVREEGAPALLEGHPLRGAAFLDPGAELTLGQVRCRLEAPPPSPASAQGAAVVDPAAFDLLLELAHPATAAACLALLREAPSLTPAWVAERATALHPADPAAAERLRAALQAAFTQRIQSARATLTALLGQDPGADAAAAERLLAPRRASLGPQVLPAGWLSATRDGA